MMGVVDETGLLEPGQCFLQRKKNSDSWPRIHSGPLLVAKNPSYHKGDMRVLNAVVVPQLKHIVNCIVFPNHGTRPHSDGMIFTVIYTHSANSRDSEIAGSDLDGDQYFVCWDPQLIPRTVAGTKQYGIMNITLRVNSC